MHEALITRGRSEGRFRSTAVAARRVLALRFCSGFATNVLFANQMDLLQSFGGYGESSALQIASWMSAVSSLMPLIVGVVVDRINALPRIVVLSACVPLAGGIACVALALGDLGFQASSAFLIIGLGIVYPIGYGALASVLPVYGCSVVAPEQQARFMTRFFIALSCGSTVGLLVSGLSQVENRYGLSFVVAIGAILLGALGIAFNGDGNSKAVTPAASISVGNHSDKPLPSSPSPWLYVLLVPFYLAYQQWTTTWYVQAQFMDRRIGGFEVPLDALQVVERLVALGALVVLQQHWSYSNQARASSPRCRLALGLLLSAAALLTSSIVEVVRRHTTPERVASSAEPVDLDAVSSLNVAWLVPQFAFIALAEAFVFPAQTEWAGSSASLVGLGCAVQAAASTGLGFLLPHVRSLVPDGTPNAGRYELYFGGLAVLCIMGAVPLLMIPTRPPMTGEE